jgi:hypothetical protein
MSAVVKDEYKPYRAGDVKWIYAHNQLPPMGVDLHILQLGGVAIRGNWQWGHGFIGWQYMFKRDKDEEAEYFEWMKQKGEKV